MRCALVSEFGWTFEAVDGMDMRDVFALFSYWVTWPPNHKLRAAVARYKAPMRTRKMQKGRDLRTQDEQIIEYSSHVIPFKDLPEYVKPMLLAIQNEKGKNGGDPTNRN